MPTQNFKPVFALCTVSAIGWLLQGSCPASAQSTQDLAEFKLCYQSALTAGNSDVAASCQQRLVDKINLKSGAASVFKGVIVTITGDEFKPEKVASTPVRSGPNNGPFSSSYSFRAVRLNKSRDVSYYLMVGVSHPDAPVHILRLLRKGGEKIKGPTFETPPPNCYGHSCYFNATAVVVIPPFSENPDVYATGYEIQVDTDSAIDPVISTGAGDLKALRAWAAQQESGR